MSSWRARIPAVSLPQWLTGGGSNPPPNPWGALLAGFTIVAVAAVITGVLITLWSRSRPVNLTPMTDALADLIQQELQAQQVSPAAIAVEAIELRYNPAAVWRHYTITAELPLQQSGATVLQALRDRLEPRFVGIDEGPRMAGTQEVRFIYAGAEFVHLHLAGGRLEIGSRRDLTPTAQRLAAQVQRIVQANLPEEGHLAILSPEPLSDAATEWERARMEAFVPDGLRMRDIQRALEGAMADRDVSVRVQERPEALERIIRVHYQRYPVVELMLTGQPPRNLPPVDLPRMETPPPPETPSPDEPVIFDPAAPAPESIPMGAADNDDAARAFEGPPRVAIIVDDGGEEPDATEVILGLDPALTLAILPDTTMGTALARRAAAAGFEVMLHMPMESGTANAVYPNSLPVGVDEDRLVALIDRALEQVPGAVGLNNHTGGAFTADTASVERLMRYLQTTSLYFVDSRTTPRSVAHEAARRHGIPSLSRDIFLDNEADFDYIAHRFHQLMDTAQRRGYAVGIAHFRPRTAEALVTLLPRLEEEGIRLVPVSELLP